MVQFALQTPCYEPIVGSVYLHCATEDYIFYDEDFLQLKNCISVITEMGGWSFVQKKTGAVEFLERCL